MNDLLLRIQDACVELSINNAWQLVVPGVISVIVGLFLWLGGARYAGLLIGLLGAVVGAACGLFASQWFDISIVIATLCGAALVAIVALVFKQTVMLILAAVIFATVCGSTYVSYVYKDGAWKEKWEQIRNKETQVGEIVEGEGEGENELIAPDAYLERLARLQDNQDDSATDVNASGGVQKLKDILKGMRITAGENRGMLIMCILLGGAVGLAIAFLLKKIIMALCCSIVGSAGVIGGMVALFFAKGRTVFSDLQGRETLIPIIFIAMIIFGCLVQTLLAAAHTRSVKSSDKEKDNKK